MPSIQGPTFVVTGIIAMRARLSHGGPLVATRNNVIVCICLEMIFVDRARCLYQPSPIPSCAKEQKEEPPPARASGGIRLSYRHWQRCNVDRALYCHSRSLSVGLSPITSPFVVVSFVNEPFCLVSHTSYSHLQKAIFS